MIYDFNIEKLEKKYNEEIKNFQFEIKIENMINIKRINEVVYNTYDAYNSLRNIKTMRANTKI